LGYFRPQVVPRNGDNRASLGEADWSFDEIADEFRAQIAQGMAMFPGASHVSSHMIRHFGDFDPSLGDLVADLCAEYGLKNDVLGDTVPRFEGYAKFPRDPAVREDSFIQQLSGLAGGTYMFVDHPAVDTPEMRATGHAGYEDVQQDRTSCLHVLTSPRVKAAVEALGIDLIDYRAI
jgi:hypothetical protein